VDEDDEVAVRGVGGSQQRWPAKLPTASRWRLGVEQQEEDEDFGLFFSFSLIYRIGMVGLDRIWSHDGLLLGRLRPLEDFPFFFYLRFSIYFLFSALILF
jgi:hypothetical protein